MSFESVEVFAEQHVQESSCMIEARILIHLSSRCSTFLHDLNSTPFSIAASFSYTK